LLASSETMSRHNSMTRLIDAAPMPESMARRIAANEAAKAAGERYLEYIPGKGVIWHGPMSEAQKREAEDEKRRLQRSRLRHAGLPSNFLEANFETNSRGEALEIVDAGGSWIFGTRKAWTACQSLAAKWCPGYVSPRGFSGVILSSAGFGLGKTYLLSAIVAAIMGRGHGAGFIKCEDLLSRYRASFGDKHNASGGCGQSAEQIFEQYARLPLLVLDELGGDHIKSGEAGEWARSQFLRLMDRRLDAGLTTLGSTNMTRDDLAAHYGGRTMSRLFARSVLVMMDGPDYRQMDAAGDRFEDSDDPFAD